MNKITSLIIAGVIGASSIVGAGATTPAEPQQPEVITEYVYIQAEPEVITEYVYINASDDELEAAFNEGYQQGASDGYGDGYAAGYQDCMNDLG